MKVLLHWVQSRGFSACWLTEKTLPHENGTEPKSIYLSLPVITCQCSPAAIKKVLSVQHFFFYKGGLFWENAFARATGQNWEQVSMRPFAQQLYSRGH